MDFLRKLFGIKSAQAARKPSEVSEETMRRLSPLLDLIDARRKAYHGEPALSEEERSRWMKILSKAPAHILQDPSGLAQEKYVKDVQETLSFLNRGVKKV